MPCDPSESEKMKHDLTHIPFKPWCTSCVKSKAESDTYKRVERIIEHSELPIVQCDYFVLKDIARQTESFEHVCEIVWVRHIHSCETKGATGHVRSDTRSPNVELLWTRSLMYSVSIIIFLHLLFSMIPTPCLLSYYPAPMKMWL